jgi:hypothetical protein
MSWLRVLESLDAPAALVKGAGRAVVAGAAVDGRTLR